jgi:catechol 2,3-dioxygenase-like lactoylglutathione lyase family enzyme
MNDRAFDRSAEDVGNVVRLEHVNLRVPDQLVATQFYVSALGLTRDPYLVTGVENMWINAGHTQFHLPTGDAQRLRATIGLVLPGRRALLERLTVVAAALKHTDFAFEERQDFVAVRCPWGNRLQCYEPDPNRFAGTALGIVQLEFDVPPGAAEGIARFYREVLGARTAVPAGTHGASARIQVGKGQSLVFTESAQELASYDGHHIEVYVADFSGPHRRLRELGAITEESDQHQYRFLDIIDMRTRAPLFRLEHEVRSMTHPLFARPLVNRNPEQTNRSYRPGRDAFVP